MDGTCTLSRLGEAGSLNSDFSGWNWGGVGVGVVLPRECCKQCDGSGVVWEMEDLEDEGLMNYSEFEQKAHLGSKV